MLEQVELEDSAKAVLSKAVVPAKPLVILRIVANFLFFFFLCTLLGGDQSVILRKIVCQIGDWKSSS